MEPLTFEAAIRGESVRLQQDHDSRLSAHPHAYLRRGRYAELLRPFLEIFPPQQMQILWHQDLAERPLEMARELFGFLEIDPGFEPAAPAARHNAHEPDDLALTADMLAFLFERFYAANRQLEHLVGRDLSHWGRPSREIDRLLERS